MKEKKNPTNKLRLIFKFHFWPQFSFKIFGGHETYCNI